MTTSTAIIILVLLLLGNAFFVASEFAVVSARRDQLEPLAAEGSSSAKYALKGIENVSTSLAATQLGITACSLLIGAAGEPAIAHLIEWYYLARYFLQQSPLKFVARLMPRPVGEVVFLQPSMFALTNVHLYFDDSRARLPPEKGGLGYGGATSLEGVCQVVVDHYRTGGKGTERIVAGHVEVDQTPIVGAEHAVGSVVEKIADPLDAKKAFN